MSNPLSPFFSENSADLLPVKIKPMESLSPRQQVIFDEWKQKMDTVFRLHAFNHVEVSPYINRTYLDENDKDSSSMFVSKNYRKSGQNKFGAVYNKSKSYGLWIYHYFKEMILPFKRFDINYTYTSTTPYQSPLHGTCAVEYDIVGKGLSLISEAECITALAAAFEKLESVNYVVFINHAEIPQKIIDQVGFSDSYDVIKILENLQPHNKEEIIEELYSMNPDLDRERIAQMVNLLSFSGPLECFVHTDPSIVPFLAEIKEVMQFTTMSGMDPTRIQFAPGLIRNITKFTGVIYEAFLKDQLSEGSIAVGGRCDKMDDGCSKELENMQFVNGTVDLSKVFRLVIEGEPIKSHVRVSAKLIVLFRDKRMHLLAIQAAAELRKGGISTDIYSNPHRDLKHQLRYADKAGFSFGFIVMDKNTFVVRDLRANYQIDPIDNIEIAVQKTLTMINQL